MRLYTVIKIYGALFICALFSHSAFSQLNGKTLLPDMLPKNPQAFQFSRFGNIPVGKYSGTPQLSIPFYTIAAKGLEVPIKLSYSSNGTKVVEEAGWTGLGWVLEAEGSIIQNIQGTDDFGYYKYRPYMPVVDCMLEYQSPVDPSSVWASNTPFFLGRSDREDLTAFDACGFNDKFANGMFDTTPDKFTFSFAGYSGEFTLDFKTGKFECITDKNIIITTSSSDTYNLPSNFVINVPEGHRFLFELKEQTQAILNFSTTETTGLSSTIDITNSYEKTSRVYKLTQITTNQGDTVLYNYTTTPVSKNLPMISKSFVDYQVVSLINTTKPPLTDGEITSRLATQQSYSYLSSIVFTGGVVNFFSSNRTDLKEGKKLDKIEVKTTGGSLVKEFLLNYDYFSSTSTTTNWDNELSFGSYTSGKTALELTQRLRLISVKETGINPYQFFYNTQSLPKKTSYAVDFWGYYNGATNNTSFMPNIYSFNLEQNNLRFAKYQNNNRSPSIACKAGILEKIIYPTGGYTTFDWEMNTFDNVGIPDYSYDVNKYIGISTQQMPRTQSVYLEADFTLFSGGAFLSTRGCTDPNAYANCYVKIQIFKPELMTYLQSLGGGLDSYGLNGMMGIHGFINGTSPHYNTYIKQVIYVQKNYNDPIEQNFSNLSYSIPKGIVVFDVVGGCGTYNGTTNSSMASLNLTYRIISPLPLISKGGGLRIASVTSYTGTGAIESKKNYTYSGGKLMSAPLFFNTGKFNYSWEIGNGDSNIQLLYFVGNKCVLSSNSFIPASQNAMGNVVGYDKVVETQISNNGLNATNGTIVEYYNNTPGNGATIGAGAYTDVSFPAVIEFPKNGTINIREIFDKQGVKLKKETYTYQKVINDVNWGLKVGDEGNWMDSFSGFYLFYPNYLIGVYPIIRGETLLKSVVNEEFSSGFSTITQNINYQYDSYNKLNYDKMIDINGDVLESYYMYPYSFNSSDPNYSLLQQMTLNNTIAPLIQKKDYKNSLLIFTERNNYYKRLGSNGYQYPDIFIKSSQKILKGDQTEGYQVNFSQFDSKGNYTEIEMGGKTICYIYGYNQTLPIAKIENIQYNLIPTSLITAAQTASNTGTETSLITALTSLRTNASMQGAMVTAFTHKPLIGVSTVIEPNGLKTTYQYDSSGRVEFVRDNENNILSEYKYNFKP